jgi:hypothetical protein
MLCAVFLVLLQTGVSRGPIKYGRVMEPDQAPKSEASTQLQKSEFRKAFQKYLEAVKAFQVAYDAQDGNAWPEKEAKALRKAWRELQKVQPYLSDKADKAGQADR